MKFPQAVWWSFEWPLTPRERAAVARAMSVWYHGKAARA